MLYTGLIDINPADKTCKSCDNFLLHYIKSSEGRYYKSAYGHCKKLRQKVRYTTDRACERWQKKA